MKPVGELEYKAYFFYINFIKIERTGHIILMIIK